MHTTVQFLDAAKARLQLSDYALAKRLSIRPSAISNYRTRGGAMAPDVAARVAELLGLDPAYVVACVEHERSRDDAERAMWTRIAHAFSKAAMLAIVTAAPFLSPPADARAFNNNLSAALSEYTLRKKRGWLDSLGARR